MSAASQAIADQPVRPATIRCRSLTLAGRQCRAHAIRGQDLCVRHTHCRHPVLPTGHNVVIPLFEDLESVQVFITQVAQGILARTIDTRRAGKLLYACQVAANTMPRPERLRTTKIQAVPDPVTRVSTGPEGHLLGPIEDTRLAAPFQDYWSHDKYRYDIECERLGRPEPGTPAEMPESGWLTPEEITLQQAGKDPYKDKILELRLDADRRGALPPIIERTCSYGKDPTCSGPGARADWRYICTRCGRERDAYFRLHPAEAEPLPRPSSMDDKVWTEAGTQQPEAPVTDLQACARESSRPHVKSANIANMPRINAIRKAPARGAGIPSRRPVQAVALALAGSGPDVGEVAAQNVSGVQHGESVAVRGARVEMSHPQSVHKAGLLAGAQPLGGFSIYGTGAYAGVASARKRVVDDVKTKRERGRPIRAAWRQNRFTARVADRSGSIKL